MKKSLFFILRITLPCLLLCATITWSNAQNIYSYAGNKGYTGDGNYATNALLSGPQRMTWDADGNMYIAEIWGNRIRKVDAQTGIISTYVGTGEKGYEGDGEHYSNALIGRPGDLIFDADGNFYFTDEDFHTVRKIDAETGVITTIAGTEGVGAHWDGEDPGNTVATAAYINKPMGLAIDNEGNMYVAEMMGHSIRKLTPNGSGEYIISTYAGTGSEGWAGDGGPASEAKLKKPQDLAMNSDKTILYIGGNNVVRKINLETDVIEAVAGDEYVWDRVSNIGGDALDATIGWTQGIAVNENGDIYLALRQANCIGIIDAETGKLDIWGQTRDVDDATIGIPGFNGDGGDVDNAKFDAPWGIDIDPQGNIYVADIYHGRVRRIDKDTKIIETHAGGYSGDGLPVSDALFRPNYIASDNEGNIYFTDDLNHTVRRVDSETGIISTIAGNGGRGYSGDNGPATEAELFEPQGLAIDAAGNVYVADKKNHSVRKIEKATGKIKNFAGTGTAPFGDEDIKDGGAATNALLNEPVGLAFDADGNLYIADSKNHRVRKVGTDGNISTVAGTGEAGLSGDNGAATEAQLNEPVSVGFDADGFLYIVEAQNHAVRMLMTATGNIMAYAGGGGAGYSGDGGLAMVAQLNLPADIAVDQDGNKYIADTENHCIRKVDGQSRVIATYAGTGETAGFDGDEADPATALFDNPKGITFNNSDLFICDNQNNAIRWITTVSNTPPVVEQGVDNQSVSLNSLFELDVAGTFTDSDANDFVAYKAEQTDGTPLPKWLHFDAQNYTFSGTANQVGTINVKLVGVDRFAKQATTEFTIDVQPASPTLDGTIDDITLQEEFGTENVDITGVFGDPNNGAIPITYSVSSDKEDVVTATLEGMNITITEVGTGSANITVEAENDAGKTSTTFKVVVNKKGNSIPTVANSLVDKEATEDVEFTCTFDENTFEDADPDDVLTYTAKLTDGTDLSETWLSFDAETRTFSGTPENEDVGEVHVKVTATDKSGAFVSDQFIIVVNNTNDAPIANSIDDQEATVNVAFSFDVPENAFEDVDVEDELTYSAELKDGSELSSTWLSFDGTTFSGTPTDEGTLEIVLTATDNDAETATIEFSISVVASAISKYAIENISMYPNPATNALNINFGRLVNSHILVNVMDLTGHAIISKQYKAAQKIHIDLKGQTKGIYMLNIIIDNEMINKAFIIK